MDGASEDRITVHVAGDADLAALEHHLPTGRAAVHAAHLACSRCGSSTYLVARADGVPVGTGAVLWGGPVGHDAAEQFPGVPEIAHLQVGAAARGRGAGTALVRFAEDLVRRRGGMRCLLGVEQGNHAAQRLYARLGYRWSGVSDVVTYEHVSPAGERHELTERDLLLVTDLLRPAVPADAPVLHAVSLEAIRVSAAGHYSAEQLAAWAGRRTLAGHERMIERTVTLVALVGGAPAGFVSLALHDVGPLVAGELDQLFVHPDHGGRGLATALLSHVDRLASETGIDRLVTHASWRAVPVFERHGWSREEVETVTVAGQVLTRCRMGRVPAR